MTEPGSEPDTVDAARVVELAPAGPLEDPAPAGPPSADDDGPGAPSVPVSALLPGFAAAPGFATLPATEPPTEFDAWNYPGGLTADRDDLAGFHVEALDGRVGKVDKSSHTTDDGYLVVDIGTFVFGRTVLLPAGIVTNVDTIEHVVHVARTREQIKAAPEIDRKAVADERARAELRDYYRVTAHSHPDGDAPA